MPPNSPTPAAMTRTRIKWESVMILLMVIVAIVLAAVAVVASEATTSEPTSPEPATTQPATVPIEETADAGASTLTLDDAKGLVEEARQLIGEARFDEAADRLAAVPEELFADSGASVVALELEGTRSRYTDLRAQFDAAVEARQWADAKRLFGELAAIATPNDELLQAMAQVEAGLDGPAAPATRPAATAGGGAVAADGTTSTATKPSTSATKPTTTATKPKPAAKPAPTSTDANRPAGSSGAPSGTPPASGGSSTNPLAPIELSPEAEAALNEALGIAAELQ